MSKESPCGHGTVICFSVYCGEDINFGESMNGEPADGVIQDQLWVDTMVDDTKDKVCSAHHKSLFIVIIGGSSYGKGQISNQLQTRW